MTNKEWLDGLEAFESTLLKLEPPNLNKRFRRWSLRPEDAGSWYIWKHMPDETKDFYRRDWSAMKHIKGIDREDRSRRLHWDLLEWYSIHFREAFGDDRFFWE